MSRTHHDSYRAWGDYRKQRELVKDFSNWKQEALEEMEEQMASVFVIMNEWIPSDVPDGDISLTEIVGGNYFTTEDDAWDALSIAASAWDIELPQDETSFSLPKSKLIELLSDEYYIQELTHG